MTRPRKLYVKSYTRVNFAREFELQSLKEPLVILIARAQQGELNVQFKNLFDRFVDEIQALLIGKPGYQSDERRPGAAFQPKLRL